MIRRSLVIDYSWTVEKVHVDGLYIRKGGQNIAFELIKHRVYIVPGLLVT